MLARATRAWAGRAPGLVASGLAVALLAASPAWDRELLASGAYLYAPFVPPDLDLTTQLRAGTLLYYREGASATVSVKRLTGTNTLAVDGKVDASNRGDMLTQKLIAHLPLLVHDRPEQVAVIGLGSGATAGAALSHPVSRVDVIEISPEVVEASAFFTTENRDALKDPRTPPDRRRRPLAPAAFPHAVRRHHLGAVEPVDCRRRGAVHARVLRGGARPPGTGRRAVPVGERLQHQRRRTSLDRRDVPGRVPGRDRLARRR